MKTFYLDESGDLGFDFTKTNTSSHFLLSFLMTDNPKPIQTAVKKVFRSMSSTDRKRAHGILHAHYEKRKTRERLLKKLSEKDFQIALMVFDKRKTIIVDDTNSIYNSMVTALINRLHIDGYIDSEDDVKLIASQSNTNKRLNERFKAVVLDGNKQINLTVEIKKPFTEKALQAVDFIAWSFGKKYEHGDSSYAEIVEPKIVALYEYY